ncbi:hypothetical protein HXX02_14715 [Microbulbifer elongatus]|uniref:Uncharacterized protein n=1 Tax=Microbulbifer elongatus TaxID=86173 RepID=A0ABT1P3J7_9GAMM|nr:hypothetical protein [Microbulbifer elongatus]MCQ3830690.1 hypothetical protein [Microbulbifer elongatus]
MNTDSLRASDPDLERSLKKNEHTLVVMDPKEFVDFIVRQKLRSGMSREGVSEWMDSVVMESKKISSASKKLWQESKGHLKSYGSYVPALADTKVLAALAYDMHKGGDVFSTYQIKTYSGRSYVMFKGYSQLRSQLTGTRYLANNPKVVSLGVGKLGAAKAIKGGLVFSVVFSVAFHSIEQLLNDRATWHDFVAGVSVDVVSAVAGSAIAWSTVSTVVGAAAMATIGPIALVVVVGVGATYALSTISENYGLSKKLSDLLKAAESRMINNLEQVQRETRRGLNYMDEDPIGFMHRLFGIPYLRFQ